MIPPSNSDHPDQVPPKPNDSGQLLPYYVYELRDQSGATFYVGKGQGNRAVHHTSEVQRMLKLEMESPEGEDQDQRARSAKQHRIAKMLDAGETPQVIVIGRFETEDEAFAVETVLINWVYGYENLTNISRGRRAAHVRPCGNHGTLPSIDIPRSSGERNGDYAADKISRLQAAGAYDFLSELRAKAEDRGFDVRGFEDQSDRRFHPGESNGQLAFLVRVDGVDLMVNFSFTKRPSICIANTLHTRANVGNWLDKLKKTHSVSAPKNLTIMKEGRYRSLGENGTPLKPENIDDVLSELERIRQALQG